MKRHRARRVSSGLCGAVPRLACIEIGGVALKSVQKSGDSKVSTVLHFPLSTEKQRGGDVFLSQSLELTLTSLQGLKGSNPPSLSPRRWVFGPPTLLAQTPATRFLQLLLCLVLSPYFLFSPLVIGRTFSVLGGLGVSELGAVAFRFRPWSWHPASLRHKAVVATVDLPW